MLSPHLLLCVCGDGVKRVGGREGVEQVSAEISVWYTQTSRLVDRAAGRKKARASVGREREGEEEEEGRRVERMTQGFCLRERTCRDEE